RRLMSCTPAIELNTPKKARSLNSYCLFTTSERLISVKDIVDSPFMPARQVYTHITCRNRRQFDSIKLHFLKLLFGEVIFYCCKSPARPGFLFVNDFFIFGPSRDGGNFPRKADSPLLQIGNRQMKPNLSVIDQKDIFQDIFYLAQMV